MLFLLCLLIQQAASLRKKAKSASNSTMQVHSPFNLQRTNAYGGGDTDAFVAFDHWVDDGLAGAIHEICVSLVPWGMERIEVNYAGNTKGAGGSSGSMDCFRLNNDTLSSLNHDTIYRVDVYADTLLRGIEFYTTSGRFLPFGYRWGNYHPLEAPAGMHLMSVHGSASWLSIGRIGFYWGIGGGTGGWEEIFSQHGNGLYREDSCSWRSEDISIGPFGAWSYGVLHEMSGGFSFAGSSTRVAWSHSQQIVTNALPAFFSDSCSGAQKTCDKNHVWQWTFRSNFDRRGEVKTTIGTSICTDAPRPKCLPGTYSDDSDPSNCDLDPLAPRDGLVMLKSARSGLYLHVDSGLMAAGNPIFHRSSVSVGSQWQIENAGPGTVMLKSARSGHYLHVNSYAVANGDAVIHLNSQTDGSQWQVERVGPGIVMLKSVRSGFYLHVGSNQMADGDPVFHFRSTSEGSQWQVV